MIKKSQMGLVGQSRVRTHGWGLWSRALFTIALLLVSCPSPTLSSSPKCGQVDQEAGTLHLTSVGRQPGPADSYPHLTQLPCGLHQLTLCISRGLLWSPLHRHYEVQIALG